MAKSDEAKSATCFSGILRRLLCNGGLPTHPSDQIIESNCDDNKACDQKLPRPDYYSYDKEVAEVSKTPGVVARLMGLESLPASPLSVRHRTLGSYLRSRSVNSIDFSKQFDHPTKKAQHQHRRVRTSVSFREGVENLELGGQGYGLVLHELNGVADETEELLIKNRPKVKIHKEKGIKRQFNDKLQERNVNNKPRNCGVGNVAYNKGFNGKTRVKLKERRPAVIKQVDCKEAFVGPKYVMKKKKKQGLTQNVGPKKAHSRSSAITEVSRFEPSRKLSSSQIVNPHSPYLGGAHCDNGEVKAINKRINSDGRKMKNDDESCYYKRMVETICSVTKEDLEENWKQGNLEEFEETCHLFGQEILQVLLKQIVDEMLLLNDGTRGLLFTAD